LPCIWRRSTELPHKAELEQFAINVRCTPKSIVHAHPPDQRPQFRVDLRPTSRGAGFPPPVATKPSAMPAHKGLWPDNHHGLEDRQAPTIKLDEEQPIAVRELDPTAHPVLQHNQLLPQRGILCFKSAPGLEERRTHSRGGISARPSRPTLSDSVIKSKRTEFSAYTGRPTPPTGHRLGRTPASVRRCRTIAGAGRILIGFTRHLGT
jgi:hypothetical protein